LARWRILSVLRFRASTVQDAVNADPVLSVIEKRAVLLLYRELTDERRAATARYNARHSKPVRRSWRRS
jgi:hypothetical protein